ncbi:TolB family protein [Klenkia terrae]|uniref:TolB family protein n=1 Tax=Klenkia terrae TaxID=1052259 RepID=UPI00361E0BA2
MAAPGHALGRRPAGGPRRRRHRDRGGGGHGESVVQPSWAADGSLLFFADRTGVWALYRWRPGGEPELLLDPGGDMAGPQWVFGASRYAELADGRLVVAYGRDGADRLAVLEPGGPRELPTRYASFGQLRADGTAVVCVAGGPTSKPEVVRVPVDGGDVEVLRPAPRTWTRPGSPGPSTWCSPAPTWTASPRRTRWSTRPPTPRSPDRPGSCRPWWSSCTAVRPPRRPRC